MDIDDWETGHAAFYRLVAFAPLRDRDIVLWLRPSFQASGMRRRLESLARDASELRCAASACAIFMPSLESQQRPAHGN
jgi:hypothetical protein